MYFWCIFFLFKNSILNKIDNKIDKFNKRVNEISILFPLLSNKLIM